MSEADSRHNDALDGLRGLAAATVFISHFSNQTGLFGGLLGRGAGQVGVMLFFALSGFLMGRIYLGQPFSLAAAATYARRRVARVVPLYLVVVAAAFATGLYPVTAGNLVEHLLFIRGESVLWTIPVEVQAYALFVPAWAACSRYGRSAVPWLAVLVALFLSVGGGPASNVITFGFQFFALGMVLSRAPAVRCLDALFVLALMLFFASLPGVRGSLGLFEISVWRSTLYLLVIGLLLYAAAYAPLAQATLGSAPMRTLGLISYSVYLLHEPVIGAVARGQFSMPVALLAATAATLIVASATYLVIERPMRRLIAGRHRDPSA